ncbi:FliM/FliN family flagellar motor switch protein [Poseidonocella sedimentorum]|uniref:FliM/FliN family flagellar motor switch protein n=1 Tax=Poseidonocella sedimentorum TaxID=871652 RepID=UPI0015A55B2A|nr:FliM/FliN family flagellar motor switch protein [Poseidonocella sedimentorum]
MNPALQRKAAVARRDFEDREVAPRKALRLALSKSFDETISLPLAATKVREIVDNYHALMERLLDDEMLILLDGPDGALGCIMLDRSLAIAIVEMQTLGFVPRNNHPRSVTRTDAAIAEPVLNDLLKRFAGWLPGDAGLWAQGYMFGARVPTVRSMGLNLPELDYRIFEAEVDIFLGARIGRILFALPAKPAHAGEDEASSRDPVWAARLEQSVGQAQSELHAVAHRYALPLAQLSSLRPGDTLPFPAEALENVTLYSGQEPVLARIRLGQAEGYRALRFGPVPGTAKQAPEVKAPEAGEPAGELPQLDGPKAAAALPNIPLDEPEEDAPAEALEPLDALEPLEDLASEAEAVEEAEEADDLDFDFELPDAEPFELEDLPMPGAAPAGGAEDDIGMPMAVVEIDFDDI